MFSTGVSHFWLDIQLYLHQALAKAGAPWDRWTAVIRQDLAPLLLCGTTAFIPPDCARRDSSALISGIREGECWSSGHAVKENDS